MHATILVSDGTTHVCLARIRYPRSSGKHSTFAVGQKTRRRFRRFPGATFWSFESALNRYHHERTMRQEVSS